MPYGDPGAARVARNWVIRVPIVSRSWFVDRKNNSAIFVKEPARSSLRKAAEVLAYQFKRETRFDFAPYTASARNAAQEVRLLPSQMVLLGGSEAIAGAIGVIFRPPGWHVHWLWVHPYERGQGLIDEASPHMVKQYDHLDFEGPFTPSGARLIRRLTGQEVEPMIRMRYKR